MQSQARKLNQKNEKHVAQAALKESGFALFFLTFIAVIREGVELAIFLAAAALNADGRQVLLGAGLGLAAVIAISFLLFKSLIRLNISKFFQVTSIILILFAAGLVAHGIHEFNEVGLIPAIIEQVWDINHLINEKSLVGELLKALFGYNGNPSLTEVTGYILFYMVYWAGRKILKWRKIRMIETA